MAGTQAAGSFESTPHRDTWCPLGTSVQYLQCWWKHAAGRNRSTVTFLKSSRKIPRKHLTVDAKGSRNAEISSAEPLDHVAMGLDLYSSCRNYWILEKSVKLPKIRPFSRTLQSTVWASSRSLSLSESTSFFRSAQCQLELFIMGRLRHQLLQFLQPCRVTYSIQS